MKWPDAVPFDPSQGTASPALEALFEGPGSAGPVLLLAVGRNAQKRGWGAQTAISLADAFAARGDSVILADLSLNEPELHALLGSSNDEGLTDVFLFGASLDHTTLTIPGKRFRLVPASAYTPDAREILEHARWRGVFEEVAQDQSKLLIYLPVDIDGADMFADRVGHTIALGERSDMTQLRDRLAHDADVIAVLTIAEPVTAEPVAPLARTAASGPSIERRDVKDFEKIRIPKDSAREALIADLRSRQRAALMAPPPVMQPLPHDETTVVPLDQPPATPPSAPVIVSGATPQRRFTVNAAQPTPRTRTWIWWLLLAVVVIGVGTAGWYWWRTRSAADRNAQADPENATAAGPAATQPVLAPVAEPTKPASALPYSVAIASYHDLEVALGRLDQLIEQAPDLSFYIGPIDVQGRVFYRIMAGPMGDSAAAVMLRDTLLVRRIKTISSNWDVLKVPFTFQLGSYERREDATAQQGAAIRKGIPSHVVATTNPAGTPVYNVNAGAFAGPGDAQFMRSILKSAGFPDNLVERTGNIRS